MTRRTRGSLGVDWHLPDATGTYKARRFATTTIASSNLIEILAELGYTWSRMVEEIRYDEDARAVAQRFVDEGYGDVQARLVLTRPDPQETP